MTTVSAEYVQNPTALRARQFDSLRFFDGLLMKMAGCIAEPERFVNAPSLPLDSPERRVPLEREIHFSMVYDLLNRQAAHNKGTDLSDLHEALAQSRQLTKRQHQLLLTNPHEWLLGAQGLNDDTLVRLDAQRPLPQFEINTASSAFIESFSSDTEEWRTAVAHHDPALYEVMSSQNMPLGEVAVEEQERREVGSLALYALTNQAAMQARQ